MLTRDEVHQEIKKMRECAAREDVSPEERLEKIREVRKLLAPYFEEQEKNRKRVKLIEFPDVNDDHEKHINELNDAMSTLARQMISLGAKVEELTETVRNLIKGGSKGWPRN